MANATEKNLAVRGKTDAHVDATSTACYSA